MSTRRSRPGAASPCQGIRVTPLVFRHALCRGAPGGGRDTVRTGSPRGPPVLSPTLPPWLWPRAAYLHVPFCAHQCGYCDFAIAVGRDDLIDRYLDALAAEMAGLGEPRPVETIFVGGGTPSHLSPRQLERLLGAT